VSEVLGAGPVVDQREQDLATLHRQHLRVLGGADHLVIGVDRLGWQHAEVVEAVGLGVGKVLPGRERLAVVGGLLQGPDARPRRVGHLDVDVGHVELLAEVDRQIHLVVLEGARDGRRLPPLLRAVDRVVGVVVGGRVARVAVVAVLALFKGHS